MSGHLQTRVVGPVAAAGSWLLCRAGRAREPLAAAQRGAVVPRGQVAGDRVDAVGWGSRSWARHLLTLRRCLVAGAQTGAGRGPGAASVPERGHSVPVGLPVSRSLLLQCSDRELFCCQGPLLIFSSGQTLLPAAGPGWLQSPDSSAGNWKRCRC